MNKILLLLIVGLGACSKPCNCNNLTSDSLKAIALESENRKLKDENEAAKHIILDKDRALARERATNHTLLLSIRAINKTIAGGLAQRDSALHK